MDEPFLSVVKGVPADDELAALVAVVSAVAAAARATEEETRAAWANRRALVRRSLAHGRGAWRASGLPG